MAQASRLSTSLSWLILAAFAARLGAQPAAVAPQDTQPATSSAPATAPSVSGSLSVLALPADSPPVPATSTATAVAVTSAPAPSTRDAASSAPADAASSADPLTSPSGLAVRPDDVIVFLGDELTEVTRHRGSFQFPTLVETFMTVRYPDVPLRFVNAGWSHDTAGRALLRLEGDVLTQRPNVVVICLGLNDPDYLPFDQGRLEVFRNELTEIVRQCRQAGARVWLMTPPSVEEDRGTRVRVIRNGQTTIADLAAIQYDRTLSLYAQTIRDVARATRSGLADWYQASSEGRDRMRASSEAAGYTRDGLNPLARGNALGATTLLRAWSAEPILVRVQADWNSPQISVASQSPVTGDPRWRITADSARELLVPGCPLPWPMSSGRFESLSPDWIAAEMCRFELQVSDAPQRGVVISRIDPGVREVAPATIPAGELETGINLATLPLLQTMDVVQQIYSDIGTKNLYHYTVWRRLKREPPREPELAPAHEKLIDTWLAYEAGYELLIRRRPKRVDLHLRLRANVKDEQLPTSQPERPPGGIHQPVPLPPPSAGAQSAPAR